MIITACLSFGLYSANVLAAKDGFQIRLEGETNSPPLVTIEDVLEYRFAEHALTIRSQAVARLPELKSLDGEPFQVMVDGECVYKGRFVPDISSMSYPVPTIWMSYSSRNTNLTLTIHRPLYREAAFLPEQDRRSDPRIRRALEESGKLVEGDLSRADFDPELTSRLDQVLQEVKVLGPGSRRKDFIKNFLTARSSVDGSKVTFVHQRCPYVRLEVEFTLVGRTNPDSMLEDVVQTISGPYLTTEAADRR